MKLFKKFYPFVFLLVLLSCTEKTTSASEDKFDVSGIVLPSSIIAEKGESVSFKCIGSTELFNTDVIRFISVVDEAKSFNAAITAVASKNFSIDIPEGMSTGKYEFWVLRDKKKKKVGIIQINIKSSVQINPDPTSTVYGVVECDELPLEGVVVSDGFIVTTTDENGIYQLESQKKHKYVFISVPSGYEAKREGAIPQIYQTLVEGVSTPERADFELINVGDQTNHTMLFLGDIHLANRNDDDAQFGEFLSDINTYREGKKNIYGTTLGDLTWDIYWMSNGYDLKKFLTDIKKVNDLSIYQTIGNHDHSAYVGGDFGSATSYKELIGPTYYSYNIGKIHYVVLDDIDAQNTGNFSDPSNGRVHIEKLVGEQIEWLKMDLSYISKDVPLIISMHAPLNRIWGTEKLDNNDELLAAVEGYKVHFVSGHTHRLYNVDKLEEKSYFEHNSGAICGTWWWSGKLTPGVNIGPDGAPAGYQIFEITGKDIKWQFKATGKEISHQFRTYDRNEMEITAANFCPKASENNKNLFNESAKYFSEKSSDNKVYINVFNWDPAWTVTVTENGKDLGAKKAGRVKDPLHLIAYEAKRFNTTSNQSSLAFRSGEKLEMFVVQASSPTSTLEITITDRFGNVYKETMKRPKAFNTDIYR